MELILTFLVGGGLLYGFFLHGRRLRGWQETAAACGLEVVEGSAWKLQLTARTGPVEVKIGVGEKEGQPTRIVVSIPGPPGFSSMSIRRKPLLRWATDYGTRREAWKIKIGDGSFDDTFLLEGPMPQILALLDAETRRLLTEVSTKGELELSASDLRLDMSDEWVPYVLRHLLDIGRRFMQATDIPQLLTENARRDPEPGVRLRNLLALARESPNDPRTFEALRTACSDPSPEVRLQAAKELGAEGRDLLLDLAESLVDDAVSAEAVAALARALPLERTRAILDRALARRLLQTPRACLEALGLSGDAAAEPALLLVLQHEEEDLQMAAASALGRVGSVEAVLPLKEAAERSWLDLGLRRATRQAIAEIQSRLPDASPGQLSLAGVEAGQLSLAQAEAGQLSLATDPAGQLSLQLEEPEQPVQRAPAVRLV
jgi:hypothetical protein